MTNSQIIKERRVAEIRLADGSTQKLEYILARSRRKSYSIEINSDLLLTLRVPLRSSMSDVNRILTERAPWILKNLAAMKAKKEQREENRPSLTPKEREKTIENAIRNLRPLLAGRIAYYEPMLPRSHRRITRVTVRAQKTRWGSCSAKGGLNFNWKLYLAPPEVLDYVVVHELCHLCEMNHQAAFWTLVESIMPDYRTWRKWLADNGHTLDV